MHILEGVLRNYHLRSYAEKMLSHSYLKGKSPIFNPELSASSDFQPGTPKPDILHPRTNEPVQITPLNRIHPGFQPRHQSTWRQWPHQPSPFTLSSLFLSQTGGPSSSPLFCCCGRLPPPLSPALPRPPRHARSSRPHPPLQPRTTSSFTRSTASAASSVSGAASSQPCA